MTWKPSNSRGKHESPSLAYLLTVHFLSILLNLYYRHIETWGAENIPPRGPTIFVAAPHCNQLLDPAILANVILQVADRPVSNLIPNFWAKKTFIGFIARHLGSVILERASDFQKPGTGRVFCPDLVYQPMVLRGIRTKFTTEAQVGGVISLPSVNDRSSFATIQSILGDEEIRLKRPFSQPQNAAEQLSPKSRTQRPNEQHGSAYTLAPKLDRSKLFESLSNEFDNGRNLLIFPEGASHDRPALAPLQNGVAHMVLNELNIKPHSSINLVPCGLNYSHQSTFRSQVLVEFGPALKISSESIRRYRTKGQQSEEAVQEVLEQINRSLVAVTSTAPDLHTQKVVRLLTKFYCRNTRRGLAARAGISRSVLNRYTQFKDRREVIRLVDELFQYEGELKDLHIRDADFDNIKSPLSIWTSSLCNIFLLPILLITTVPGMTLFGPVLLAASHYAKGKAEFLTSISSFRIKGNDTIATWTILACLTLTPPLYSFYTLALAAKLTHFQSMSKLILMPETVLVVVMCIFLGLCLSTIVSILTVSHLRKVFLCLRFHFFSLSSKRVLKRLEVQRMDLRCKVFEFVNGNGSFAYESEVGVSRSNALNIN